MSGASMRGTPWAVHGYFIVPSMVGGQSAPTQGDIGAYLVLPWEQTGEAAWEKLRAYHSATGPEDPCGVSSDEDDDGVRKPKLGSGLSGHGPPRSACMFGKRKDFADCSPGRWALWWRGCASDTLSLAFSEELRKASHSSRTE